MPYTQGESLRDRLDRENQLPVEEAVRIASDVAEALEAAHAQGVIHRDIKPANILLSRGRPLVADFGIALAVSAAGGGRLTETGLSMGTPFYMSPEQATADRDPVPASDVYSLGCVLFEMLVGDPPHVAGSAQAVLAKILTEAPVGPRHTRASVPEHVDAAVRRALQKIPADRFGSAAAFAGALSDPHFRWGPGEAGIEALGPRVGWNRTARLMAGVAAVLAILLLWTAWPRGSGGVGTSGEVAWLSLALPADQDMRVTRGPIGAANSQRPLISSLAFSPDGSTLVYRAEREGTGQLFRRRLDNEELVPITGTEQGYGPFFSPDGREVGFWTREWIHRVPLEGGVAVDVVSMPDGVGWGATWTDDDWMSSENSTGRACNG